MLQRRESKHDKTFFLVLAPFASVIFSIFVLLIYILTKSSLPAIKSEGFKLFTGTTWDPQSGIYQILPMFIGTLETSILSLLFAFPLGIAGILFINEYISSPKISKVITTVFEVFAGFPSILFGIWGAQYLSNVLLEKIMLPIYDYLGFLPFFSCPPLSGFTMFTASILLSIMILPYVFSMLNSAYTSIPQHIKDAAYSIGMRKYQVFRLMLSYIKPGAYASILLGFGKSVGETVAVSLVIGNINNISYCLFSPGMTISSLIASQFPESYLYPGMISALFAGGLLIFSIGMVANYFGYLQTKRFRRMLKL